MSYVVIAPLLVAITIGSIIWMIQESVANRYEQLLPTLGMLAVFWVTLLLPFFYEREHPFELHETAKWSMRSQYYKSEVLARPESTTELKHIEWDMSGFAGIANNTVYLVFDPADTLSTAAKSREPGKFDGIPCKARLVRRLESHWYGVLFYTDEYWGACK
ncbi:MAG: hypothetical protein WCD49_18670 [Candidatus Acidiferrales bacterium]